MTDLVPSSNVTEILAYLQSLRNEANIAGMGRFGIVTDTALGISTDEMRRIVRVIKKDHAPRPFALADRRP